MSELSFQAVQFIPRFVSVIAFLALTWLVARFAKSLVLRATGECRATEGSRGKVANILANISFWAVFVTVSPFLINLAGVSTAWVRTLQQFQAQVFVNWPLWMIMSLLLAGIAFVVRGVPKVLVQLKGSMGTSQSEV